MTSLFIFWAGIGISLALPFSCWDEPNVPTERTSEEEMFEVKESILEVNFMPLGFLIELMLLNLSTVLY